VTRRQKFLGLLLVGMSTLAAWSKFSLASGSMNEGLIIRYQVGDQILCPPDFVPRSEQRLLPDVPPGVLRPAPSNSPSSECVAPAPGGHW